MKYQFNRAAGACRHGGGAWRRFVSCVFTAVFRIDVLAKI